MRRFERILISMRMLFHRRAETARLNDELQFHLEQPVKENAEPETCHSLCRREATAVRSFGNPGVLRPVRLRPHGVGTGSRHFFATYDMVRVL